MTWWNMYTRDNNRTKCEKAKFFMYVLNWLCIYSSCGCLFRQKEGRVFKAAFSFYCPVTWDQTTNRKDIFVDGSPHLEQNKRTHWSSTWRQIMTEVVFWIRAGGWKGFFYHFTHNYGFLFAKLLRLCRSRVLAAVIKKEASSLSLACFAQWSAAAASASLLTFSDLSNQPHHRSSTSSSRRASYTFGTIRAPVKPVPTCQIYHNSTIGIGVFLSSDPICQL